MSGTTDTLDTKLSASPTDFAFDRTRCTGCTLAHDAPEPETVDVRAMIVALEERMKDLKTFTEEVDNWEDLAHLNAIRDEVSLRHEILTLYNENVNDSFGASRYGQTLQDLKNASEKSMLFRYEIVFAYDRWPETRISLHEADKRALPSPSISHEFKLRNLASVFKHYEILTSANQTSWLMVVVKTPTPTHIAFLGQLLLLHPMVWMSHMWRDLQSSPIDSSHRLLETPWLDVWNPSSAWTTRYLDFLFHDPTVDFSRVKYQSSLEGIEDRSWKWYGSDREHDDALANARRRINGTCLSEPLLWKMQDSSFERHGSMSFLTSTTLCCLQREKGDCDFGLVLQTPMSNEVITGSHQSFTADFDPYISSMFSVSASLAFYHRYRALAHHPFDARQVFLLMEVSSLAQSTLAGKQSVRDHVQTIRYLSDQNDKGSSILATRARESRVLFSLLQKQITSRQARARQLLPLKFCNNVLQTLAEISTIIDEQLRILDELDYSIKDMRDGSFRKLQIELTQTQIDESRRAIKQADKVARLTVLAFIYIPTSCVCGIFGMNIIETPEGFPLWGFCVTLGAVLFTTLLIAFAGPLYLFSAQASFYGFKYLVYEVWYMKVPVKWEPFFYTPLERLVRFPGRIKKSYRERRESVLSFMEKGRHLEPHNHGSRKWFTKSLSEA